MSGEQMKILISPTGMIVDAEGYVGDACVNKLDTLAMYLRANGVEAEIIQQDRKIPAVATESAKSYIKF